MNRKPAYLLLGLDLSLAACQKLDLNVVPATASRLITVERPAGFATPPANLYLTGKRLVAHGTSRPQYLFTN